MVTVQDGTQRYELTGRVGAMVLYLARKAQELGGRLPLRVEFHCAGKKIKPKLLIDDEPIEVG